MSNITLINDVYDFQSDSAWYLIHDGVHVIAKGQGGQATSKNIILEYETDALMQASIVSLELINLSEE